MADNNIEKLSAYKRNFIIISVIYWIILIVNIYFFVTLNSKINTIKTNFNGLIFIKNDNELYENRLTSLESKYIDVLSSKEIINTWLTILTVLLPVVLWLFVYQKWKMENKAENEVEKVEKLMKEATDKINNLDKIVDSEIEKKEKDAMQILEELLKWNSNKS